jgi:hypothetical protein
MIFGFHRKRNSFENADSKNLNLRNTLLSKESRGMELQGYWQFRLSIIAEYSYRIYNAIRKEVLKRTAISSPFMQIT